MKIPVEDLKSLSKKDFSEAWKAGARFVDNRPPTPSPLGGKGSPHPLNDLVEKLRDAHLSLGFDEAVNRTIIPSSDVIKEWGPAGYALLDRCFFLAGLPRPNVGLGDDKIAQLEELGIGMDGKREELRSLLQDYKRGEVEGDDLPGLIGQALGVSEELSIKALSQVFPEIRDPFPEPTDLTLRSHMTAGWFHTLAALQNRRPLPIRLFSIGLRYRREQREDASHLRVHSSASSVIMDEDVSIETGKEIVEKILEPLGFDDFKYERKETGTDFYYAPGKHFEAFARHPSTGDFLEVSDFGIYSPASLAQFGIEWPVLNNGFGVERLAMILYDEEDIRELVYPQFYGPWELTDREIAEAVHYESAPHTEEGERMMAAIIDCALKNADAPSPCAFTAWENGVKIELFEPEKGVKLLGPAALNHVVVEDGSVLGVEEKRGVDTGKTFLSGLAAKAARLAERGREAEIRAKMVSSLGDVNLSLDEHALHYITSRQKRLRVEGPTFVGIRVSK